MSRDMSGTYIGPVLPPGFKLSSYESDDESDSPEKEDSIAGVEIGPVIPDDLRGGPNNASLYGPTLPPGMRSSDGSSIIGPTLPPHFTKGQPANDVSDSDNDEDLIGPLACEAAAEGSSHFSEAAEIEKRSQKMKDKLLGKEHEGTVQQTREEWMTALPTNLGRKIGLGPRTFSRREPAQLSQDRSAWTDTPADKEKKLKDKGREPKAEHDNRFLVEEAKNQEMAKQLEKYNKSKRKESLLDMHRKKRKKTDEKNDSTAKVRKEFDRDQDLGITRLDPLKAKSAIDGAKLLNGRFSHGSSHFL